MTSTMFNLRESKLYALSKERDLLNGFAPDIRLQMAVEMTLEDGLGREASDGDDMRIIINYTNSRGRSLPTKTLNHFRMESSIDVDDFLSKMAESLQEGNEQIQDPIEQIGQAFKTALNLSVLQVINVEPTKTAKEKNLANTVLVSLLATIFDDPLDVFIQVQEVPTTDGTATTPMVVACWRVKARPEEAPEPVVN